MALPADKKVRGSRVPGRVLVGGRAQWCVSTTWLWVFAAGVQAGEFTPGPSRHE